MKRTLIFFTVVMFINAAVFCCCEIHPVFAAQEHSCCTKDSSANHQDNCQLQNDQPSQGHSCTCQAITGVLPTTDLKSTSAFSLTGSFAKFLLTSLGLTKIRATDTLVSPVFSHAPPDCPVASIFHTQNSVLRL